MKYCTDTWFILKVFANEEKAKDLMNEVKFGKSELVIPMAVVSETYKKLLAKGISEVKIDSMFRELEATPKVTIEDIDFKIAKEAAKVSLSYSVPLVDSVIASTGKLFNCHFILSEDSDMKKLDKARYVKVKYW